MIQRLNRTFQLLILLLLPSLCGAATVTGYLQDGTGAPLNDPVTFTLTGSGVLANSNAVIAKWIVVAQPVNGFFQTNLVGGVWSASTPSLPFPVTGITVPPTNAVYDWLSLTTNATFFVYTNLYNIVTGLKIGFNTNLPQYDVDAVYTDTNATGKHALRVLATDATSTAEMRTENSSNLVGRWMKLGPVASTYKLLMSDDTAVYNDTGGGNIDLLNDNPNGSIAMAAGGQSTSALTIKSNGLVTVAGGLVVSGNLVLVTNSTPGNTTTRCYFIVTNNNDGLTYAIPASRWP